MAELNGAPVTADELQALALVNYGHFTSMRVEDRHVRGLSLHMDRLVADCRAVFDVDLDRDRVRALVRRVAGDLDGTCVVRVTVFDPTLQLGRPGAPAEPQVLVTIRSAGAWPPPPMRVRSAGYVRDMPRVKHAGLFGAIRHRRSAQRNGFDDALFTQGGSVVSEGPTWNVAFFDGENVVWPRAEVLPGTTMRLLQRAHPETVTAPVDLRDASRMRAAFATNTAVGVRPITAIDTVEFPGEHEIFDALREKYAAIPMERL